MAAKPSIPKGTRDFSPVEMAKRNYIFNTIRDVYHLYGFQQIETPSMEMLSTLMGKYGDEGDKLLFKIQNSGDYFSGITDEQQQRMLVCFGVREESFLPEDLIYDFNDRRNIIGLIISGTARVERVDERGVRTILEHLERESVFGEMLMFDNIAGDSLTVVCEKDCRVWFIPADHLVHPCENACAHHSQMIQNMFRLVAEKASALSERVEVLSRRSIRDKLLCYFAIQAGRCGGCFTIPFSLSTLADYISADRSAMMRELKKMREAGLVEVHGRQVCVLQ